MTLYKTCLTKIEIMLIIRTKLTQYNFRNKKMLHENNFLKKNALLLYIFLGIILSFGLALFNEFTYDDHFSILENKYLTNISFLKYLLTEKYFAISNESSFRPVVTLLNFVEFFFFGQNPFGYHLINIFLHFICSILVFFLLKKLFSKEIAFVAAALHAIHPVMSETVVSAAFAEDLLCAIFILTTLIYSEKWLNEKKLLFLIYALISYTLALGSKEMAFFYPIGFLIFLPFLTKKIRQGFILFGLLIIVTAVLSYFRFFYFLRPERLNQNTLVSLSKWFGEIYYLPNYLISFLFPYKLSIIHPVKTIPPENVMHTILYWGFFLIVFYSGIRLWLKKSVYGLGILWFLTALIPVSGIMPLNFPYAERYIYIPIIGLNLCTAKLLSKSIMHKKHILLLLCIAAILITRSALRTSDWKDDLSLWKSTARTNPRSPAVRYSLGKLYHDTNQLKKAELEYRKAIHLNKDYLDPYINLAVVYMDQKDYKKALAVNKRLLKKNPAVAIAHLNNAMIYRHMNMPKQELASYIKAIKSDQKYTPAYKHLALYYLEREQLDDAANIWEKGIQQNPHWIEGYTNLVKYYSDRNENDTASKIAVKGLKFDPNNKILRLYLLKTTSN